MSPHSPGRPSGVRQWFTELIGGSPRSLNRPTVRKIIKLYFTKDNVLVAIRGKKLQVFWFYDWQSLCVSFRQRSVNGPGTSVNTCGKWQMCNYILKWQRGWKRGLRLTLRKVHTMSKKGIVVDILPYISPKKYMANGTYANSYTIDMMLGYRHPTNSGCPYLL